MKNKKIKNVDRGIRTANLKIPIHNRLMLMKIDRAGVGMSELIEELLDFYEANHKDIYGKKVKK